MPGIDYVENVFDKDCSDSRSKKDELRFSQAQRDNTSKPNIIIILAPYRIVTSIA